MVHNSLPTDGEAPNLKLAINSYPWQDFLLTLSWLDQFPDSWQILLTSQSFPDKWALQHCQGLRQTESWTETLVVKSSQHLPLCAHDHVDHGIFTSHIKINSCWSGSRKGIQPVKNWVMECWRGYVSGSRCRFAYGPGDATATHCLAPVNPDWFYLPGFIFLVPAHPAGPEQNPTGP